MKITFRVVFIFIAALVFAGFGDPAYFANQRGNEKYNEEKYDEALKEYLEAQRGEPDEKSIDYNLGGAYYKTERYDEAARAYGRALSSESEKIKRSAQFNLGAALYKAGEMAASSGETDGALKFYTESAKQYISLLTKDSTDNDARHNLELALLKIKGMDQKKKQEKQKQDNKEQQEKENEDKQEQSGQDKNDKDKTGRDEQKEDNETPQQGADKKDEPKDQNEQKPKGRPEPKQITREQAERIFDAIWRDEIKLKENMRKGWLKKLPESGKDW